MFEKITFLASGAQGQVYSCERESEQCILKVFNSNQAFKLEHGILKKLNAKGYTNFPMVKKICKHQNKYAIVTNRLGSPLNYETTYSFEAVNQIGLALLTLLEQVHSVGFVYADLKPDNILIGNYDLQADVELKLIDFGMSSVFRDDDGNHINPGQLQQRGNLAFASPNSAKNLCLSRRDDLFSLFLLLAFLSTGVIQGGDKPEDIQASRANMDPIEMCK